MALILLVFIVANFYDWKYLAVPVWLCGLLIVLVLIHSLSVTPDVASFLILTSIGVIGAYFQKIGWGDTVFFSAVGCLCPIEQVPLFLITTGVCGILTAFFYKSFYKLQRFPLILPISVSLMLSAKMVGVMP